MADQSPSLDWRGDVPVSTTFDDPYFSLENGLAETRHVFLDGNGLPGRFRDGFRIAELGFGTGLNLLATLALWRATGQSGQLRFTSFEAFPLAPADMIRAQAGFADLAEVAADLAPVWRQGSRRFETAELRFELIEGDARATLPRWSGAADAWFLDGFAPARNPALWEPPLMAEVVRHMAPHGTAATYTAAGHVRRALAQAGLDVQRVAGYGRKRHMTIAKTP